MKLMENLSKSVKNNTLKSELLFQGKLFIIVRDVAPNEPQGLTQELVECF